MKTILFTILYLSFFFSVSFAENNTENYLQAFDKIKTMLETNENSNFEDAIFEIENAYHDNQLSKIEFKNELDFHVIRILQLANANKDRVPKQIQFENTALPLSPPSTSLRTGSGRAGEECLLNWAIFTYLTDTNWYKQADGTYAVQYPMVYETTDPFGKENWETTQITSLLKTHKGNCFSLAALYYIFSLRLQTQAYLVTAPNHIFIQHKGFDGNYFNIELTTKTFPGSGTIKTYTYTTHEEVINGVSMRRLNEKEAVALCLVQLAKGFKRKATPLFWRSGGEAFALNCADLALQHDSLCLTAMLLKKEVLENQFLNNENGFLVSAELANEINQLKNLGYRQMPHEMQSNLLANAQGTTPLSLGRGVGGEGAISLENEGFLQYYTLSQNKFPEIQKKDNQYAINNSLIDPIVFALSIDPLAEKFPSESPYNAMGNDPINMVDPDGRDLESWITKKMQESIPQFILDNGDVEFEFEMSIGATAEIAIEGAKVELGFLKSQWLNIKYEYDKSKKEFTMTEKTGFPNGSISTELSVGILAINLGFTKQWNGDDEGEVSLLLTYDGERYYFQYALGAGLFYQVEGTVRWYPTFLNAESEIAKKLDEKRKVDVDIKTDQQALEGYKGRHLSETDKKLKATVESRLNKNKAKSEKLDGEIKDDIKRETENMK